ncbi:molybdopterin-dependent oxidoreductase [Eggerthella sinensis]|uniref:molybdopterin-dependent oxidoreductase n=1 Tax=Eggerthella sinensis TaxID=242230 RepID=UPI001D07F3AA|nr:molybdopterin-dependent oxidoreductase [Eggerthella sinensis]MCB7036277.1 molybdopterin-dependent oxidoreductase [Eggerthella sinensis]
MSDTFKGFGRLAATASCVALVAALAGCAPQQGTEEQAGAPASGATNASSAVANTVSMLDYDPLNPIVKTRDDGTVIQRMPTEDYSTSQDADAAYNHPEKNVPYNTYYAKADARGCNACHEDLAATIDAMPYGHVKLSNDLGIEVTLQQCLDCHEEGPGYQTIENSFGTVIHGIHDTDDKAACWNCHNATNDDGGMQLWDVVKHDQLRGITPVEDVEGDFTFSQEETIPAESIFDFDWQYWDLDYVRADNEANNVPLDEQMFNDWTITVTGEVDQDVTYQLTDLIAEAPSETVPMVMHCTYNPTGGPLIGQSMVTGIPLDWLLDKAGLTDDAVSMFAGSPDGNSNSVYLSSLEGQKVLIVYEIDGERLSWRQGYPVQLWAGGVGAPVFTKELSDVVICNADEEVDDYKGWVKSEGGFYNKPNVGIFNLDEGQVVAAGEPYAVKGYASAWDDPITGIEFSMDGGETWTRCETPNANTDQWVTWSFTITPEADTDTAYVLRVRATSESGLVTEEPLEKLFNARTA